MQRQRRILYIDHTAVLGGGEIALLNLLRHIDRARFAPTVLLCSEGPLVEKLREANVPTHILPLAPSIIDVRKGSLGPGTFLRVVDLGRLILYVVALARFIRRNRFDLVHTNSLKADIIGGLAARLAGTRLLWHVRDRIDKDYLPHPVVIAFRTLCRLIPDHVVAVSHATLATIDPALRPSGNRATKSRRMHVVHDGIEGELFRAPALVARNGVSRIGLVGRISPFKGQHIFLEAATAIRARFPNARFQIIGGALFAEDDYEARVRAMAASPELRDAVEFTGFRSDVPALISKLDILVHASTTGEPFGQVVVEGMAAGKPVVATRGGGVPEIVVDGVTGLLVPMADAAAMAQAVCRLLQDPALAEEMGRQGQERALACFSVRSTAANVERVYTDFVFSPRR
jgi:glycosyltransferase involved in cell wall biosynthesis